MNARPWVPILLALLATPLAGLQAEESAAEVDTQFIFGFTQGADVGEPGEKEIEFGNDAAFGARGGTYAALVSQVRGEFAPVENLRIEIGLPFAYHDISGVAGLNDIRQGAYDGVEFEIRYRLLDRQHAPFALTLGMEPHFSRVDDISGQPVANYGAALSVAADREFLPDRLFGAVNLVYDPEVTRPEGAGPVQRQATLGVFGSVAAQVVPGVFLGTEARYLSTYDQFGLGQFSGQALFLGPTTFIRLSETAAVSAAWGIQVAGHAVDVPGSLDLTNFTRQQAVLRLEYNF